MLIGFLLPLLRRAGARTRMLIAVAVIATGLALVLVPLLLRGHGHAANAPLIRYGMLATLAGLGLLVSAVRGGRRRGGGRERADDQP
jgi:hypothetical protein